MILCDCGWVNCGQPAMMIIVCICGDGHIWEAVLCGAHVVTWEDHARKVTVCGCGLGIAEYGKIPVASATDDYAEEHHDR